jgi:hypothetical protein
VEVVVDLEARLDALVGERGQEVRQRRLETFGLEIRG